MPEPIVSSFFSCVDFTKQRFECNFCGHPICGTSVRRKLENLLHICTTLKKCIKSGDLQDEEEELLLEELQDLDDKLEKKNKKKRPPGSRRRLNPTSRTSSSDSDALHANVCAL